MKTAIAIGPLAAVITGIGLFQTGFSSEIIWTAAVTVLVAIWWITEPIPIPATSLIPLAIFPLVGVLKPQEVGESYGSPLVLLMLGGFILSSAMERSGAHRRIALNMVRFFGGASGGTSGRAIVFGFMAASAFLSMWISNAATTLMLLPIAMAVVSQTEDRKLQVAILLGISLCRKCGWGRDPDWNATEPRLYESLCREYRN